MKVWLWLIFGIFFVRYLTNSSGTDQRKNDRIFLSIVWVMIVFVMGSRNVFGKVETDLINYHRMYKLAGEMSWGDYFKLYENIEWGYRFLNKLLSSIIKWPQFIIYFEAGFVTFFSLRAIYKYAGDVFAGVMAYIAIGNFVFALTGFRQAIAFSICLYSLDFLMERKHIKFLIAVFIAQLFHQTALVFFATIIFSKMSFKKGNVLLILIVMIIVSLSVDRVMELGNEVFERDYQTGFVWSYTGGIINIIIYTFSIFLCILSAYKKSSNIDRVTSILNFAGVVGVSIYSLKFEALVMERIAMHFLTVIPLLFAKGISEIKLKTKSEHVMLNVFLVIMCVVLFVYRVRTDTIIDYEFFWQ